MCKLPPEYMQALINLCDLRNNGFFIREVRRESRRGGVIRFLALDAAILGALLAIGYGILFLFIHQYPLDYGDLRFVLLLPAGLFSGGQIIYLILSVQGMASGLILSELENQTLHQLFLTCLNPFEILTRLCIYPLFRGLIIIAAGLPFYGLLLGMGNFNLFQVLTTQSLLILLCIPMVQWKIPGLSEFNYGSLVGQTKKERVNRWLTTILLFSLLLPIGYFLSILLDMLHPLLSMLLPEISEQVWGMAVSLPISLPLFATGLLSTPLTWFGLPLFPIIPFAVLLILSRIINLWKSSSVLKSSAWHQVYYTADAPDYQFINTLYNRLCTMTIMGYLWGPFARILSLPAWQWWGIIPALLLLKTLWRKRQPTARTELKSNTQAANIDTSTLFYMPVTPAYPEPVGPASPAFGNQVIPMRFDFSASETTFTESAPSYEPAVYTSSQDMWRTKSLSIVGAKLLQTLVKRDRNPILTFYARRILPGSMGSGIIYASVLLNIILFLFTWFKDNLIYLESAYWSKDSDRVILLSFILLMSFLFTLKLSDNVASCIRKARENDTWEMLFFTRVSDMEMALGHGLIPALQQGYNSLWNLLISLFITTIIIITTGNLEPFFVTLICYLILTLYIVCCMLCGLWVGLVEKRPRLYTVLGYVMPVGVILVIIGVTQRLAMKFTFSIYPEMLLCLMILFAIEMGLWKNILNRIHKIRREGMIR